MGVATLVALTVVVISETTKVKPGGSPLIRLTQVIVSALKKRNIVIPADPTLLYHNRELDATISSDGTMLRSGESTRQ
ncbi:hypothetical protein RND71_025004 [Anisodus tanguticus]|uniref:Uncharacterized protein n=1 Tax=Anisodus tanguticus TaxID=243964 RepID=A0AAE1V4G0_9SOLA|nr:hypothetical protein RND71_025004 [Anisodus tanguticus]